MKLAQQFQIIKLFILLILIRRICCVISEIEEIQDSIPEEISTYMPLILTLNNNETQFIYVSSPVDNYMQRHSKRNYHYFCPLENENDFELNESLLVCEDSQCLFHKTTIDSYDEKIRCVNEIIIDVQPVRHDHKNCEIYNNIINVTVKIILRRIYEEEDNWYSQLLNIINQTDTCEKPIFIENVYDVHDMYGIWIAIPFHFFYFDKDTLTTHYSLHTIPIPSLPHQRFNEYTPFINEENMEMLRNDYYTDFDLQISYQVYNNTQTRHKVIAQQFVSITDYSLQLWKQSTLFNLNVAPMMLQLVNDWNKVNKLLHEATEIFREELIVYTGIINEIPNENRKVNRILPLMRISYPFEDNNPSDDVSFIIPSVWYKIVGTRNSNHSLIIILFNDLDYSLANYNIKNCTLKDSRWERIFREPKLRSHEYLILCKLDNAILTGNKKSNVLFEEMISNPASLI